MSKTVFIVKDNFKNIRLDRFLKLSVPEINFLIIARLVRTGKVLVNGMKTSISYRTKLGDEISVCHRKFYPTSVAKKEVNIPQWLLKEFKESIVYEDEDIIAIDKKAGICVQRGSKVSYSIADIIKIIDKNFRVVHRLDKETSGILLIAKNREVASALGKMFKEGKIIKRYLALVKGKLGADEGRIEETLDGKEAVTLYRVVTRYSDDKILIELSTKTGRKHQLRRHMKYLQCPIVGDRVYGSKSFLGMCLRAVYIKLKFKRDIIISLDSKINFALD